MVGLLGVALAVSSCVWNVNASPGPGAYPVLRLVGMVVGIVIALMPFVETREQREGAASAALYDATKRWTAPTIIRSYENTAGGMALANREASILAQGGYRPARTAAMRPTSTPDAPRWAHRRRRRSVACFGGSRTKGRIVITFVKQ